MPDKNVRLRQERRDWAIKDGELLNAPPIIAMADKFVADIFTWDTLPKFFIGKQFFIGPSVVELKIKELMPDATEAEKEVFRAEIATVVLEVNAGQRIFPHKQRVYEKRFEQDWDGRGVTKIMNKGRLGLRDNENDKK